MKITVTWCILTLSTIVLACNSHIDDSHDTKPKLSDIIKRRLSMRLQSSDPEYIDDMDKKLEKYDEMIQPWGTRGGPVADDVEIQDFGAIIPYLKHSWSNEVHPPFGRNFDGEDVAYEREALLARRGPMTLVNIETISPRFNHPTEVEALIHCPPGLPMLPFLGLKEREVGWSKLKISTHHISDRDYWAHWPPNAGEKEQFKVYLKEGFAEAKNTVLGSHAPESVRKHMPPVYGMVDIIFFSRYSGYITRQFLITKWFPSLEEGNIRLTKTRIIVKFIQMCRALSVHGYVHGDLHAGQIKWNMGTPVIIDLKQFGKVQEGQPHQSARSLCYQLIPFTFGSCSAESDDLEQYEECLSEYIE